MRTLPRLGRPVGVAAVATTILLLAPGVAWGVEGRIQQVESSPGVVDFVLSAEGLAEGESIDPESVQVTIGGVEAPSDATGITESVAAPTRTVMLTLDSSGSMAEFGKLDTAKAAANTYLASLPADVNAGLIAFADDAEVRVGPTKDRGAVSSAIAALQAEGSTALNDAVVLAVDTLGTEGSRNIVLLSDGEDEGSETSARRARNTLSDSGVVLDAVSLGTGEQEAQLAAFAEAGNGTVVTATDAEALTAAFESAARSVVTQLAVRASVPEGVADGTAELTVTALVGEQQITDTTAALITAAPEPSASASEAFGPIAVQDPDTGILSQPWFLVAVIGAIFVSLATITSVAVGAIDSKNRKEGRVARRLEEVSVMGPPIGQLSSKEPETVLGESVAVRKAVSFADRVAATRDTTGIARKLEEASVSLRPGEWVVVHALITVLAGLLTTLFTNFNVIWTVAAIALGLILPWTYLSRRAEQRRKKFYASMPDSMQMLAGSLSAGYSLPQALDNVAKEAGGPLGQEINRALLESRLGLPIEEALEAVAQRMDSKDFHWVVMAIRINRKVGGNLAEVLTNVGMTLRERERLRRQVKTLSAEGVLSAWILGVLPLLLAFFIALRNPGYLEPLVTTVLGWIFLAVGAVLYVAGIIWLRNLVKMEV